MPFLNTQMWVGKPTTEGTWYNGEGAPSSKETPNSYVSISYKFYKKQVASKMSMLNTSALPEKTNVTTAVEEVRRR